VNKVNAIVFVGDAMEEDVDELSRLAGQTDEGQVERLSRKVLHPFAPDVLVTGRLGNTIPRKWLGVSDPFTLPHKPPVLRDQERRQ
jgi:hypothetical protein